MRIKIYLIVLLIGDVLTNVVDAQTNLDGNQQNNIEQNIENITENSANAKTITQ